LGTLRHLRKVIRRHGVQEIIVASRDVSQEIAETLETVCREMGVVLRRAELHLSPCGERGLCQGDRASQTGDDGYNAAREAEEASLAL